jgi:hypothetical protein
VKRLLKARILLKADASELGERWSDGQIIKALDTNETMVWRVRRQFVEAGLEAVLNRKQRATPAIAPIFDGEKTARLTALACCERRSKSVHKCWNASGRLIFPLTLAV